MSFRRSVLAGLPLIVVLLAAGCGTADPAPSGEARSDATSTTVTATTETATSDRAAPERAAPEPGASGDELQGVIEAFIGSASGGVDVLVTSNGTTQRAAAGVATDAGDPLEPGRPFRVGSISKPFVATMVLQLVDEGRVDLDATVGHYLPHTPVGAEVTIAQLLSHHSGIPNYTDQLTFFAEVFRDRSRQFEPADIIDHIVDDEPGPTGQFAYSNTNYILAGQLIEHLDGTDLNTALQARITGPLGLGDTFFDTGDRALPDDLVGGWSAGATQGDPSAPYAAIASSAWAAGALISTTDDLAAFLLGLAEGQLMPAESLAAMTDFGPAGYGLGLHQVDVGIDVGVDGGRGRVGHGGSIIGFNSMMAIEPDSGDVVVAVVNNDALMVDRLLPQLVTVD